jgi:hypothetical protein
MGGVLGVGGGVAGRSRGRGGQRGIMFFLMTSTPPAFKRVSTFNVTHSARTAASARRV